MGSISRNNKEIIYDKKIFDDKFEIEKFDEPELIVIAAVTKKSISKTTKHEEYDKNFYLSRLNSQTKFTFEDRIEIFKEVLDTNLTDMKISKVLKLSFKVSMTRINNKRIKIFQVNCVEIKQFEMDEFEEPDPKLLK
jgi:hypothetical protein